MARKNGPDKRRDEMLADLADDSLMLSGAGMMEEAAESRGRPTPKSTMSRSAHAGSRKNRRSSAKTASPRRTKSAAAGRAKVKGSQPSASSSRSKISKGKGKSSATRSKAAAKSTGALRKPGSKAKSGAKARSGISAAKKRPAASKAKPGRMAPQPAKNKTEQPASTGALGLLAKLSPF
jgi:hypothetical protein